MKNLATKLNTKMKGYTFFTLFLIFFSIITSNNLLAQRNPGFGVVNPGGETGEWIGGNGKIYTLTGKVGIGTPTPARKLHIWGSDHRYFRVTSQGGTQFSNAVAGVELERRLNNGSILNWNIVNQGTFKIRRNTTTLFNLQADEAQLGTLSNRVSFHVWGKSLAKSGSEIVNGAFILGSHSGLPSNSDIMKMDGNSIETDNDLHINLISDQDIDLVRGGGNIGIGYPVGGTAKVSVESDNMHLRMVNQSEVGGGASQWYMGVSDSDWAVGEGKLVFSPSEYSSNALVVMTEQGRVGIGMTTPNRTLDVDGNARVTVLEITGGADLAEPFEVAGESIIEAGTIVAIDPANAGQLKVASTAYDKTVAGIISGAGDIKPGMVMGQDGSIASGEHPVALTGRVYAKVDARYGAIQPGDLLTTSDTLGHAMKVSDPNQAQGAIIGKAMTALEEGQGLVLVLVSLQ
ncbi:MAG: hypothetical protein AAF944_29575 [Bacteroidota bacterium]